MYLQGKLTIDLTDTQIAMRPPNIHSSTTPHMCARESGARVPQTVRRSTCGATGAQGTVAAR
jgi:hypothetical protein